MREDHALVGHLAEEVRRQLQLLAAPVDDGVVLPAQHFQRARRVHAHLAAAGCDRRRLLRRAAGVVEGRDRPEPLRGEVELSAGPGSAGRCVVS